MSQLDKVMKQLARENFIKNLGKLVLYGLVLAASVKILFFR